jgi:hypothetical protein
MAVRKHTQRRSIRPLKGVSTTLKGHAFGRISGSASTSAPGTEAHNPFPVPPADVPVGAVRAVKRTLLRSGHPGIEDPMDDDLARLIVAVVIAALHDGTTRRKSLRRRRGEPAGMTALFDSSALPHP